MKNVILFDTIISRQNLLPLTYTRPISEFRVGITTLTEKWENKFDQKISICTEPYLSEKYPQKNGKDNIYILGNICPTDDLFQNIKDLHSESKLVKDKQIIAFRTSHNIDFQNIIEFTNSLSNQVDYTKDFNQINFPWDVFRLNGKEIEHDFKFILGSKKSIKITDKATVIYNEDNIFIEEGAIIKASVLNAEKGPIYIGKNVEIQEGSLIRGPFAICESSTVNMGAKIKGDTTIGPHSKVGGEVSNSVIFGYSNKGHDGFIGNTVIGEWCNLGADTNTSNLKNNYAEVRLWNYGKGGFQKTGLQFCGLIMGDHSKCGINTMFNTGTVIGVNSNIFGSGFPRNFVPSYSWGGANGFETYTTKKAFEVAKVVMNRRNVEFSDTEEKILNHVFEVSREYRVWDKK